MIPCLRCGREAFLYRGLCDTCAPELHAQLADEMAAYDEVAAEFKQETGKEPLEDWWGFEGFINRKIGLTMMADYDFAIPPELIEAIQLETACQSRWLNYIRNLGDRLGLWKSSALHGPVEDTMTITWTTKDE